jgi:hypothetical protein
MKVIPETCRKTAYIKTFFLKSLKYYKFANRQSADFSVFRNLHLYAFLHTTIYEDKKKNSTFISNKVLK